MSDSTRCRWLSCAMALAAMAASGAASGCQQRPADLAEAAAWVADRHPTVPQLTSASLARLPTASYLLVDVRPVAEWSVSHLPGSFRSESAGEIVAEAHRRRVDRIVVYCSVGERSSRLAEKAQVEAGNLPIHNLAGGIFAWANEGLPLEDAQARPTRLVHPYDATWAALLPPDRRAPVTPLPP